MLVLPRSAVISAGGGTFVGAGVAVGGVPLRALGMTDSPRLPDPVPTRAGGRALSLPSVAIRPR
jgi:hypothetical protein